jgi:hypothetical protein
MINVTHFLVINNNKHNSSDSLINSISNHYSLILLKITIIYYLFLKTVGNVKYPFHYISTHFFRSAKNVGVVTGLFLRNNRHERYLNHKFAFLNYILEVSKGLQIGLAKSQISLLSKTGSQNQIVFITRFDRLQNISMNTIRYCLQSSVLRRLKQTKIITKIHQLSYFNFIISLINPKRIQHIKVIFFREKSYLNPTDVIANNYFEIVDMDFNNLKEITKNN